jgi:hypothetical protein
MGTLKVPVPLLSEGLKLSPMPSMLPSAFGRLMAWAVTALLASAPGSAVGSTSAGVSQTLALLRAEPGLGVELRRAGRLELLELLAVQVRFVRVGVLERGSDLGELLRRGLLRVPSAGRGQLHEGQPQAGQGEAKATVVCVRHVFPRRHSGGSR